MSYYKHQDAPPKRSIHDKIDDSFPLWYEPTYERRDIRSFASERLTWLFLVIGGVVLTVVLTVYAGNTTPSLNDEPLQDPYDTGITEQAPTTTWDLPPADDYITDEDYIPEGAGA